MAKVAFDVQGTLVGYHSAKVVQLFKFLEARDHTMYIWSFGGTGMAQDAARSCKLQPRGCMSKVRRGFMDGQPGNEMMAVCVDDDLFTAKQLSAGKIIDVDDIPENESELDEFVKKYGL